MIYINQYILKKNFGIPINNSISSLILERSLDIIILFLIGVIVLFGTTFFDNFNFLIPILTSLFVFFILFIKYAKYVIYLTKKIPNKKIRNIFLKIIINIYKTKINILLNSIYITIILYLFYLISLYGFIYFFTEFKLTFFDVMIVFFVSALGLSLPSSPAGIGIYEASIVFVLGYFGISSNEAISFAIIYHFIQIITILILWFILTKDKYFVSS